MSFESAPVLLIVDVQLGIDDPDKGARSNPRAETNIAALLAHWRHYNLPIIHVQHHSVEAESRLRPGLPGNDFKPEALPAAGETVIGKSTNSAFVGTGLESMLREQHHQALVIVGLTTDHCVSATTRNAADLGFDVTVVSDATAAYGYRGHDGQDYSAELIHNVNLASLNREFCRVISTRECIDENQEVIA